MPHVYNLPLTADKLHNSLHMPSGNAAAWKTAAFPDRNI